MLLEKVRKTICSGNLLENGDKVICAVSGGADSVCLLHAILRLKEEYNLTVYAAHVNHMIRGKEADGDSAFVKSICKAADVECFYREYDIPRLSKELKMGEEECGRVKRYEFFEEVSSKLGGAKIATAHNLNDNAETILFRLARGVSAEGMCGIKVKRGSIIRPLLEITRAEIEEYLKNYSIQWRNDSTNSNTCYARNRIRINVLPQLCKMFESAERKIVNTAKLISEDNELLSKLADDLISRGFNDDKIDAGVFLQAEIPILRRAVGIVLKKWNVKEITYEKIERFIEFLKMNSGAQFGINETYYAKKTYDTVYLAQKDSDNGFFYTANKNCIIENEHWIAEIKTTTEREKKDNNNIAIFDADLIFGEILVRSRKSGDRILQKGLNGTKKISDIFSDEKIPSNMRDLIPIIETNGEILFVCGLRQSEIFAPSEETKNFLVIKYLQKG